MNFEIALTKDNFRETLMNIIHESSDKLDQKQIETFKGLLHLEGELSIDNKELFCTDVNYSLNLCVELLTELEANGFLSKENKNEFDEICSRILQAQELECSPHIEIGKMVVYKKKAYQIVEIDYDELTVCLSDGDDMNWGLDVDPTEIDDPNS